LRNRPYESDSFSRLNQSCWNRAALAPTSLETHPATLRGWIAVSSAPGQYMKTLRVGFVPLTDCAPLVMAQELGLFERHGVPVHLSREIGWATIRDKIIYGELDANEVKSRTAAKTNATRNVFRPDIFREAGRLIAERAAALPQPDENLLVPA
jgi:hypothetical protein